MKPGDFGNAVEQQFEDGLISGEDAVGALRVEINRVRSERIEVTKQLLILCGQLHNNRHRILRNLKTELRTKS